MFEEKVLYRLIKILYYFGLGAILICCLGLLFYAHSIPDNNNSYIICEDSGKHYSLKSAGVRFDSDEYDLPNSKNDALLRFCIKKGGNIYKLTNLEPGKHRWTKWNDGVLHIAYKPADSDTFMGYIFVTSLLLLMASLALTVVREIVLYVIYGKKFSFKM